jgi:hypothetical protein
MDQRSADPLIVAVKLRTDENMVTYLRVKSAVSDRKVGGKGADMLLRKGLTETTTNVTPENNSKKGGS